MVELGDFKTFFCLGGEERLGGFMTCPAANSIEDWVTDVAGDGSNGVDVTGDVFKESGINEALVAYILTRKILKKYDAYFILYNYILEYVITATNLQSKCSLRIK